MRNTFSKRIFAVLTAVLLGAALYAPLTFADEADTAIPQTAPKRWTPRKARPTPQAKTAAERNRSLMS